MLNDLKTGKAKLAVVGLGYVGLPLAVAFAERGIKTIGFDVSKPKIDAYKNGVDVTHEVGNERLQKAPIEFSSDPSVLSDASFIVVSVPTPVLPTNLPDLSIMEAASHTIAKHLKRGTIVVYESTVYPGVTEEVCMPILEKESGLKAGVDFKVGYSPERINPGDKQHRLENITKVTSGMDKESAQIIGDVYEVVIDAGIFRASSIKVAEAAKVIENSQRDINIAFMNELSIIFDKMGIDTLDVLSAASTKWNFLKFYPGLVGGHCIGVDPYYLAHVAEAYGHHAQVILSGRRINDSMGKYVAEKAVKMLIHANVPVKKAKVLIMGLTFKEDCPDIRNSKVGDIINELREYEIDPIVVDPFACEHESKEEYGVTLTNLSDVKGVDAIILSVNHKEYAEMPVAVYKKLYASGMDRHIMLDVKGALRGYESEFYYWRL